jgi:acetylglutamate kinase
VSTAPIVVAKLGGNALASLDQALERAIGARLVIVHGGGAQISALMRRRGIEPRFVDGRRVTDLPSLACVRSALATVSDELGEALARQGLVAAPLRQGEVLRADRVAALGLVGRVAAIDRTPIDAAWAAGAIPLVAPVGRDTGERFLNVNADDVASAVAIALQASELVFLSDVPGVLDGAGAVIPLISAAAPPAVSGGMLPKLEACAAAVAGGVGSVRIGAGTRVTA